MLQIKLLECWVLQSLHFTAALQDKLAQSSGSQHVEDRLEVRVLLPEDAPRTV